MPKTTLEEKINARIGPEIEGAHRLWLGRFAGRSKGVPFLTICRDGHSVGVNVRRYLYARNIGSIPAGYEISAGCQEKACVTHLVAVTPRVRLLRGGSIQVRNALALYCKSGHLFDIANTRVNPDGSRECRACRRARRARLRREGRCLDCGQPAGDFSRCAPCRSKYRAWDRENRACRKAAKAVAL